MNDWDSDRVRMIKPSPSMVVSQAAKQMRLAGEDVIDLGLGEPDFDTPAHIIEAAHQAALAGKTRYTATDGGPEIKAAIVEKFRRENSLEYTATQVSVSNGAKQVIFNAMMALVNPGHEVILVAPYFVSYPDMTLLVGAKAVIIECGREVGFRLTPEALEAAITPRTRMVLLNTPCNPSGAVYTRDELRALGDVLARHEHVFILSDEIYEHIIFDGQSFVSFATACPELAERILIVNGVSKTYAMTGWRIGYGAGPEGVIKAMGKIQSQSTTNPCSVSQAAAVAALNGPQDFVVMARAEFQRRRDLVVAGFREIEGLEIDPPDGAFYAFARCEAFIGRRARNGERIASDQMLAQYLLSEGKVATVHGAAYGLEPYFRISTALSQDELSEAVRRIAGALRALQ